MVLRGLRRAPPRGLPRVRGRARRICLPGTDVRGVASPHRVSPARGPRVLSSARVRLQRRWGIRGRGARGTHLQGAGPRRGRTGPGLDGRAHSRFLPGCGGRARAALLAGPGRSSSHRGPRARRHRSGRAAPADGDVLRSRGLDRPGRPARCRRSARGHPLLPSERRRGRPALRGSHRAVSGDGLLVYMGWPEAHEDDATRAVRAGLEIVEAITTTLNPRLARDKGVQLAVRVGIHTGPVVVGAMGGDGRRENLATGETVNIAARLEGLASPNTVLISQATSRLVRGTFALEALGPTALKGVAEPMPIHRVRGLAEAGEAEPVRVGAPFVVGRGEEVGLLRRLWEQSKEGLGHAVLISGTAGLGKSTLIEVLRAHVRQEGLPRIVFRCSPYHQNIPLYPVVTHIETLLQFARGESSEVKLGKLEEVLRRSGLPLEEIVPLFAELLSISHPQERYPDLDVPPEQLRQRTLDALVAWLLAEAERHPVLTAWEDLHWADPSTLEMLGLVLEQSPTVPMLHVLTFRPEFKEPWPRRSHMTPITLNRLERPQVEALITHRAGGKTLPAEVVSHIVAKTDGVPLYVEELTKMLLDSPLLRTEGDQYLLTGPLSSVSIPDTLQDSLMARLDQLRAAKEVAQHE